MWRLLLSMLLCVFAAVSIAAQTTAFTYQGSLKDGANPANGNFDLEFKLFDAVNAGTQQGITLQRLNVAVANGVFAVSLDFGAGTLPGADRYLDIAVRTGGGGAFTPLSPRPKVNSAPYSVRSLNSTTADLATNATQLGGVAASEYVTNASTAFIKNQTTQQAASNFNISGNGSFGGQVGIGTSTPASALEIRGTSFGAQQRLTDTVSGNSLVLQGGAGSNMKIGGYNYNTSTAQPLYLSTDGANTILNSGGGNVGIGTTTPTYKLDILSNVDLKARVRSSGYSFVNIDSSVGDAGLLFANAGVDQWLIRNDGSANDYAIYDLTNGGSRMRIQNNTGYVGIGVDLPQRLLHVNGRARIGTIPLEASSASLCFNASGDLLQCGASSLRWKTDVRPFNLGLETILRLRPINFRWKENGSKDFGLGAEDVAQIAPELTFMDENGEVKGVKYDRLNVVFINAFKEQQAQIKAQKKEIDRALQLGVILQKKLDDQAAVNEQLRSQINALKALICGSNHTAGICKEKE